MMKNPKAALLRAVVVDPESRNSASRKKQQVCAKLGHYQTHTGEFKATVKEAAEDPEPTLASMRGRDCLPGAVLSAAVDVGAIIQQVLNDGEPAAGARLVQGAVAGVVSVVDVTHPVFQAVENHLLETHRESRLQRSLASCFHPQKLHTGVSDLLWLRLHPKTSTPTHTHARPECVTVCT